MKLKISIILLFVVTLLVTAQTGDELNRFRLAQSYEQVGEYQKAASIYEELFRAQPFNFQFFDALNRIYIQLKDYEKSIALVEKRIQSNPMDVNLYGLLGSTYYQKGDENKAYEIWDKSLSSLPQSQVNYRVMANYAIERRAFSKAIEILNSGKQLAGESFNFSYDLANLYSILMKYKEAAEEYCSVLANQPNQLNIIETRMSAYLNRAEAVQSTIEVVQKWTKEKNDISFLLLLSWIYMEGGQYDKAYDLYLEIDSKKQNAGADLFSFAQKTFHEEQFEIATKAYKKIIDDYSSSPFAGNAKIGYAKTSEAVLDQKYIKDDWKPFSSVQNSATEEYEDLIDAYQDMINTYPKSEIENEAYYRIGLVELYKLNNLQKAELSFKKIIEIAPVSTFITPIKKELAYIKIMQNDLDKAFMLYNEINSLSRSSAQDKIFAIFMKSKIEYWKGNFEKASILLNQVVDNLSDNYANDAIEISIIINTTKHDSINLLKFATAELLAEQENFNGAFEIYSELYKNKSLLTIHDIAGLRSAQMLAALDKLPEALQYLSEMSEGENPNIYADRAVFLMAKIFQYGIKDKTKALETYENLLAKFPNSLYLDDARENIIILKKDTNKNL